MVLPMLGGPLKRMEERRLRWIVDIVNSKQKIFALKNYDILNDPFIVNSFCAYKLQHMFSLENHS